MIARLKRLEVHLRKSGLIQEANVCSQIMKKYSMESNTRSQPYGSIASPMTPLAWVEEECTHEFDADQCPVCGKMLGG